MVDPMAYESDKCSQARRGPQIKAEMDWKASFTELLGNCHMGNIVGRDNPDFIVMPAAGRS
jgi:hypothetical protein